MHRLLVKKKYTNLSGGKWITITKEGSPLHGHHIYIDSNGKILAGAVPKEMHGKTLDEVHQMHSDAPHSHMTNAHDIASGSSHEELKGHVAEAEAGIEHAKQQGSKQGESFWQKKKEIAEHHMQEKDPNHVEKRPIPDQAPYLSKKPIHNTYSKKSPAELKAIISQAKANIKATGGNAWDKKVISVASYYLNGGQMPDDSAFGKKPKEEGAEKAPKKKAPEPEAPKAEEKAPEPEAPKYSGPHQDKIGFHQQHAGQTKEELEKAQADQIESLAKPIGIPPVDEAQKHKLDVINHYLEKQGGEAKQFDPKELAPHKGKYPKTHEAVEGGDQAQIEDKQKDLVAQMHKYINTQNKNYYDVAKEKLDIANYYASHHGVATMEAPEYKRPTPITAPHTETNGVLHTIMSGKSPEDLKAFIKDQKEQKKSWADHKGADSPGAKLAQKKIDIASYYLNGGQKPEHFGPHSQDPDFQKYHKLASGMSKSELQNAEEGGINALSDPDKADKYDKNKKKVEIIQHYLKQLGVSDNDLLYIPPHIHQSDKILDSFNGQADQNYQHTGTALSSHGIDYSDPNHTYQWQQKIDHHSQNLSYSEIVKKAKNLTKLMYHGNDSWGNTHHDPASAKVNSQEKIRNGILSGPHAEAFMKAAANLCGETHDPNASKSVKDDLAKRAIRRMIDTWASSSGDHQALSVAMQLAAKEEFGLNASYDKFDSGTTDQAHKKFLSNADTKAGMKVFLREMYDQTQKFFKEQGITHIPVVRGMSFSDTSPVSHIPLNTPTKAKMTLQPLSSFSSDSSTAEGFTGTVTGGAGVVRVMTAAMIPIERVMGCVQTGFGCMNEQEFITLGGSKELDDCVTYVWDTHGAGKKGFSHDDMFSFLSDPKFNTGAAPSSISMTQDQGHLPKMMQDANSAKDKTVAANAKTHAKKIYNHASKNGGYDENNINPSHYNAAIDAIKSSKDFGKQTKFMDEDAKHAHADHILKQAVKDHANGGSEQKEYHVSGMYGGTFPAKNPKPIPNAHGIDAFVHKISNGYKVSDGDTGKGITGVYGTQKAALSAWQKILDAKGADHIKQMLSQHPKLVKHYDGYPTHHEDGTPIVYPDAELHNADWTKQSWDLPPLGSPEFNAWFKDSGYTMSEFKQTPAYQHLIAKKKKRMSKAEASEKGYYPSERHAYKTYTKDPIYLPLNRIQTPYQTDRALDESKIKENVKKIKNGQALSPVIIGYNYDLHDGHHRLEAAKRCGHSHVPCIVGGRNERRKQAAEKRYRSVYKSMTIQDGKLLVKKAQAQPAASVHWVTIRGVHVQINGKGQIVKGPEHMQGKNVADLNQAKPAPKAGTAPKLKIATHTKENPKPQAQAQAHEAPKDDHNHDVNVARVWKGFSKYEPAISTDMKNVAKQVGGKLEGFDFRLKTHDSFQRKVSSDHKELTESGKTASKEDVAKGIKDAVRYTVMTDGDNLTDAYHKTVKQLEGQGYKHHRTKNTWGNTENPYRGVNSIFKSPSGVEFEVQFHTPESFDMKQNKIHHIYEEYRADGTTPERKKELNDQMFAMSDSLKVPKNIESIKQHDHTKTMTKKFLSLGRAILQGNML